MVGRSVLEVPGLSIQKIVILRDDLELFVEALVPLAPLHEPHTSEGSSEVLWTRALYASGSVARSASTVWAA